MTEEYVVMTGEVTLTHPGFVDPQFPMIVSQRDVIAEFCSHIITLAGVNRAIEEFPFILPELKKAVELEFEEDSVGMCHLTFGELRRKCEETAKVHAPSIARLNYSRNDLKRENPDDRPPIAASRRYDDGDGDDNFVDLDALVIDVINSLLYDYQIIVS